MGILHRSSRVMVVVVACAALPACGLTGGSAPTAASSIPDATPKPGQPPAQPPAFLDGFFSTAKPSGFGMWEHGRTYVVVFSWGESASVAAAELADRNAFALVSMHTCFGERRLDLACYARARAWMQPIVDSGRFLGVYGPDEPLHNGIAYGDAAAAVARFHADGYRVMVAETRPAYDAWLRERGTRLSFGADWYGLTAYGDPESWIDDRYRDDRSLNVAFTSSAAGSSTVEATQARIVRFGLRGHMRWSIDMGAARRGRPVVYLED